MAEVSYLGRVLHWSLGDLLDLEHPDRRAFIAMSELDRDVDA
ncbi:MAG: hypothetical protein AAGA42_05920 [Actinomycetota bacterium]